VRVPLSAHGLLALMLIHHARRQGSGRVDVGTEAVRLGRVPAAFLWCRPAGRLCLISFENYLLG
jgi:predicted RNA polymerase sigma factor